MIGWVKTFKATDGSSDYYRQWVGNVQSVHGAVFAFVESIVVLGALQFAVGKSSAWAIWVIYGIAYGITIILASAYLQAAILLLLNRARLDGKRKSFALWSVGLLAVAFNTWMVGALSDLVEQVIAAGLAGEAPAPSG